MNIQADFEQGDKLLTGANKSFKAKISQEVEKKINAIGEKIKVRFAIFICTLDMILLVIDIMYTLDIHEKGITKTKLRILTVYPE